MELRAPRVRCCCRIRTLTAVFTVETNCHVSSWWSTHWRQPLRPRQPPGRLWLWVMQGSPEQLSTNVSFVEMDNQDVLDFRATGISNTTRCHPESVDAADAISQALHGPTAVFKIRENCTWNKKRSITSAKEVKPETNTHTWAFTHDHSHGAARLSLEVNKYDYGVRPQVQGPPRMVFNLKKKPLRTELAAPFMHSKLTDTRMSLGFEWQTSRTNLFFVFGRSGELFRS